MLKAKIEREEAADRGRFVLASNGTVAELTYRLKGADRLIADHTFVPEIWRGQGIAEQLVLQLVEAARAEEKTITPVCAYVDAWRRRHPEWADVFDS